MPFRSHLRAMGPMAALDAFAYRWPLRERAVTRIGVAHG
jgi:hypothetical protein